MDENPVFQDISARKTAYYATFYCAGATPAYIDVESPYKAVPPSQHLNDDEGQPLPYTRSTSLLMHLLAFSIRQTAAW